MLVNQHLGLMKLVPLSGALTWLVALYLAVRLKVTLAYLVDLYLGWLIYI